MSLSERFRELMPAAFSGLWVVSQETNEAIREIGDLCRDEGWGFATWNVASGLTMNGRAVADAATDPLTAVKAASSLFTDDESTSILVLEGFHHFLSPEIIATVADQVLLGKQTRTAIVILSPVLRLPVELEKFFTVVEHPLPDRNQLRQIASEIATEDGELPGGIGLDAVLDAASGLTRMEAENAFSLSLVRNQRIAANDIWELKAQTLKKSGLLTLGRGTGNFERLGGLASLKSFCKRVLLNTSRDNTLKRARGVLLLSPPGCGKSEFCKLLGNEIGRPVLTLDVGSLMGSLVGQSEERTRQALQVIDAFGKTVVVIEEVEKAFAGVGGSGDSGVSSRVFSTFLTWLNDRESDSFVVCSCNDISRLPPEFGRSERFDGVFYLDLPSRAEKDAIWSIYRDLFEIDAGDTLPDDTNWTGAEVKACCRLSALLDLPLVEASKNVVPVAVSSAESIDRLRQFASGRCLSASDPGIYKADSRPTKRRRVNREPSNN